MDYILYNKAKLNKFKRTEMTQDMFSSYNGNKIEITNNEKSRKSTNVYQI